MAHGSCHGLVLEAIHLAPGRQRVAEVVHDGVELHDAEEKRQNVRGPDQAEEQRADHAREKQGGLGHVLLLENFVGVGFRPVPESKPGETSEDSHGENDNEMAWGCDD